MSITVRFDVAEIMQKIDASNDLAIFTMSEQVLADSNFYCPQDQDGLIDSSENASDLENGIIIWDTPYAQYLYYGVLMVGESGSAWAKLGEKKHIAMPEKKLDFGKHPNANAQMQWFHKAKDMHLNQWLTAYENVLRNEMR